MIHHYTDIDTLALILANRTIRFNRLDRVDDTTEAKAFSKVGTNNIAIKTLNFEAFLTKKLINK